MSIKFKTYPLFGICRLQMGKTPKRKIPEYWGEGFPWVSIADMKNKIIETTKEQITEKAVNECGSKLIRKGTLLMSFKLSIGKLGFAGTDLFTNEAIVALLIRDNNEVYPEYLYYILKTLPLTGRNKAAKGSTLNTNSLKKIPVPIPDKYEDQIRIAKILKKIDDLILERGESILLVQVLLKNIYYKMFGDPIREELGLKKIELKKLGNWKSGGTPSRKIKTYFSGDIPWLTSGELNEMYVSDSKEKITEVALSKSNASKIQIGSLLLGMYDTAALKSSITKKEVTCNQAIAFAKLDELLCNTIFVYYTIQIGKDYYRRQKRGVRQKNLNLSMIKSIKIPNPSLKLQNKFAEIVKKAFTVSEIYNHSLIELEVLFASISNKIFKGELELNKLDITTELKSVKELVDNTPHFEDVDKQKTKPRTTKVADLTLTNYYEEDFAILIKTHFENFHFRFKDIEEMFTEEEGGSITYFTTQELKQMKEKAPMDIQSFIFDCVEKKNKILKLNQFFYDALSDLQLKKIKLKAGNEIMLQQISDKQISREDLSGIYFQITR